MLRFFYDSDDKFLKVVAVAPLITKRTALSSYIAMVENHLDHFR
ncbi:hypothetical protein EV13_3087 [Prochlorococcus sp. MIT 0702]|nr:hypothetical protein EV13_3087 [Prochlorococcus sp. MIT 0702]